MIRLLPLLLALNAAAADKPLALKTLHTFPNGVTDKELTVLATTGASWNAASVNLWSIDTGKQLAHFDLPGVSKEHDKDSQQIWIQALRPDLKLILVTVRHRYYNKNYKYENYKELNGPFFRRGFSQTFLLSTEDEKNIKSLFKVEGPCGDFPGLTTYCTGFDEIGRGYVSAVPDIRLNLNRYFDGHLTGTIYEGSIELVFDLAGKKLFENEVVKLDYKLVKGAEKNYTPPKYEIPLSVDHDSQSCSVMRGDKRVSFLEGCADEFPDLSAEGKLAFSVGHPYSQPLFKAWDVATGSRKVVIETKVPKDWSGSPWTASADGRLAAIVLKNASTTEQLENGDREIQIWNASSGKMIASGSGPEYKGINSFEFVGDGRRALYKTNEKTVLVDLGLEGGPAAAPAAAAIAKVDVDSLPSGRSPANPDAFAVVIGVEKYRQEGVPVVDYAARDARTIAAYLGVMGFDAKNVAVLTDAQAGKVDFDKYFGKWLRNRVGPKSRVFVYYAGHGAPNPTTGAGYLMPYEADPSYLDETAYPVTRLYAELAKLPTKDVTVVLDACFSGQGERSLIAKGTRPLVPVQAARGPENAAVIAAASGSQISASDHEARHGLLTYHLLAGLHGEADANGDGKITTSELFAYARPAVERAAKLQNVEQTPTVSGNAGAAGARVWTTVNKH